MTDPDGLLAVGGNLEPETLVRAYGMGVFPWYEQGQPVLWWSPAVRAVLVPGEEHVSRSLRKYLRKTPLRFTTDQAFEEVIRACASRPGHTGTWITPAMTSAYSRLHQEGHAHSLECWLDGRLVGGLYGVRIGRVFCGESMFSRIDNASKATFTVLSRALADSGFALIDCQLPNSHLSSLGVRSMPRRAFLDTLTRVGGEKAKWPDDSDLQRTSAMLLV